MRIGEAADLLGVAAHVLRHWEDEAVVIPDRDEHGYRVYDDEAITRLRIVLGCQSAGMSLAQIRLVLHRGTAGRRSVIVEHLDAVAAARRELARTERFLRHVLGCRHSFVSRCPACSAYAGGR